MEIKKALDHLGKVREFRNLIDNLTLPALTPSGDIYGGLLRAILAQQLNTRVAETITRRFLRLFDEKTPEARQLLDTDLPTLQSAGISPQKAAYLHNVAYFFDHHQLHNHPWHSLEDENIIQMLTQIKGVGRWTTEMLLIFDLGRPDVMPLQDLGIQQAFKAVFNVEDTGTNLLKTMGAAAEAWRPYRTTACRYLWRARDTVK